MLHSLQLGYDLKQHLAVSKLMDKLGFSGVHFQLTGKNDDSNKFEHIFILLVLLLIKLVDYNVSEFAIIAIYQDIVAVYKNTLVVVEEIVSSAPVDSILLNVWGFECTQGNLQEDFIQIVLENGLEIAFGWSWCLGAINVDFQSTL